MDELCQHFTTHPFNNSFISELASVSPIQVLDVAAGMGSLALAARERYQRAQLTTLEFNSASVLFLKEVMPEGVHLRADLLRLKVPTTVLQLFEAADLVVCNPPFRVVERALSQVLLKQVGIPTDWPIELRQRAEVAFIVHSLSMLKSGGELGMFLPACFMTGHKYEPFRKWLLSSLTVDKVVGFPTSAFGGTQAKVFALIARKLMPSQRHETTLIDLGRDGLREGRIAVSRDDAIVRLDASFHLAKTQQIASTTLAALGASIIRGWPVSKLMEKNFVCFHTTDFKSGGDRRVFAGNDSSIRFAPSATKGDFLLGRVGRTCHTQVLWVQGGSTLISDCVYRVRLSRACWEAARRSLLSEQGKQWRHSRLHGVGASVLSKRDLLEHPIWNVGAI